MLPCLSTWVNSTILDSVPEASCWDASSFALSSLGELYSPCTMTYEVDS